MSRLPRERLEQLLTLYGDVRSCPLDEVRERKKLYWEAAIKLADDHGAAISADDVDDMVASIWHDKNRIKSSDVKR